VPFIFVPARKEIRDEAERRQLDPLRENVDLVVLARYMQILTPRSRDEVGCPLINIHHSILPAFIGDAPYRRATRTRRQTGWRNGPLRDSEPR
jgi:formyltetrahydrofolate deformylase